MDSLTERRIHLPDIVPEIPHYYEVTLKNHPNGIKQLCCGTWRDVEGVLERYPDSPVKKVYPATPQTVDVNAISIEEKALPASELEELNI